MASPFPLHQAASPTAGGGRGRSLKRGKNGTTLCPFLEKTCGVMTRCLTGPQIPCSLACASPA